MSEVKIKKKRGFTVIDNEVFSRKMTPEAFGLYSYFMHLPDTWIIRSKHIQKQFEKLGRDRFQRIMKELRSHGLQI